MIVPLFFIGLILIGQSFADNFGLGNCPKDGGVNNFDMKKMLGQWYVILKTDETSRCFTYKITEVDGKYQLDKFFETSTPNAEKWGVIHATDKKRPAVFEFTSGIFKPTLTFLDTDYINYATMLSCKSIKLAKKQSVTIMSRRATLDASHLNKTQENLKKYTNVDASSLSKISHKDCLVRKDN